MDPLTGLIGGAASLIGGFMNQSSQQAINTANLQQAQWTAEGGYLPGLIMNANKAGINPLALLPGSHQTGAPMVSGDPGSGLQNIGRALTGAGPISSHQSEMERLNETKAAVDIANARQLGNNAAIEGARNSFMLDQLERWSAIHPEGVPEGVSQPSISGTGAEWFTKLWNNPWDVNWLLGTGR